jgi:nicotinamide riboside kinase
MLICLVGAECSGKTTLAKALATHFSGLWVPEYLRTFCDVQGRTPHVREQSEILDAQVLQETEMLAQAFREECKHVFCDTAPLLTAIYSDLFFSDKSLYERAHALHSRYSLTILLAPDLPWQPDGLQRVGADVRDRVHSLIERELALQPRVARISGTGVSRVQAAISAVDSLMSVDSRICRT